MITCNKQSATAASSRLVSWCLLLFLVQLQMSRGFVVPALHSPPSLGAAKDVVIRPATASAEAEHAGGTTAASFPGGDDSAPSGRGPSSLGLTAFQEFVERRKSAAPRVLLDLRPREEFRRRHLKGSTSIPADELAPRLLELPPPFGQPVGIVGNEEVRTFCGRAAHGGSLVVFFGG